MTEEAAFIAALVVVILQIITLSLLRNTRKMVRELAEHKPANSFHNERRDRDMRQNNRRPVMENKNRPQMPNNTTTNTTAAVDPVEKSLRDINLKLKNAERDQEFARKKIQDNFSKDPNRRRENGKGGRDQRRGDRRPNWNDKNSRRDNNPHPTMDSQIKEENEEIKKPVEPVQEVPANTNVTAVAPELIPSDFSNDESMQHGRKFAPKRRSPDEISQDSSVSVTNEPIQEQFTQESIDSTEKPVESEIKFGRR